MLIKSKLNKDNFFLLSARAINNFREENQDNLKFRLDYQKPIGFTLCGGSIISSKVSRKYLDPSNYRKRFPAKFKRKCFLNPGFLLSEPYLTNLTKK